MSREIKKLKKIYNNTLLGCSWFSWYEFPLYSSVLLAGDISLTARDELCRVFKDVQVYDEYTSYDKVEFSVILVFGGLRNRENNQRFLLFAKKHLTNDGVLLWSADNKMGTRFLCGDSHLGEEGEYFHIKQWKDFFEEAGMPLTNVYYALPDWHMARTVFTDACPLCKENRSRLEFYYVEPENLFRDEGDLLDDAVACGNFSMMANGFIFEYRCCHSDSTVIYADMSPDKGRNAASVLLRYSNGKIVKKPLYTGGSLKNTYQNGENLRRRGLSVIDQVYSNGAIVMHYMNYPLVSKVMRDAAVGSKDEFKRLLEEFWQCILDSSELTADSEFPVTDLDCNVLLKRAYLDMTPTNAFYVDGDFAFFDQEYCYEGYPAKFVLYRALVNLYRAEPELADLVSLAEVKQWFELEDLWQIFHDVDLKCFLWQVRNWNIYGEIYRNHTANKHVIDRNKHLLRRIDKVAVNDMFAGLDGKSIVLFGAGVYCDRYLDEYGTVHRPALIVDNNESKWHTFKDGIEIVSPNVLIDNKDSAGWRVIICSSYVKEIVSQLENIGIVDYRVY